MDKKAACWLFYWTSAGTVRTETQRTECKVMVRCSHLGNELNDLDEDVERRVFGRDHLGPFGEEAVDNALQPALRGRVALTLYPHHVHPAQHRNSTEVTTLSMCYASICWFVVCLFVNIPQLKPRGSCRVGWECRAWNHFPTPVHTVISCIYLHARRERS